MEQPHRTAHEEMAAPHKIQLVLCSLFRDLNIKVQHGDMNETHAF